MPGTHAKSSARQATAYHESGHAVMAELMGWEVYQINVNYYGFPECRYRVPNWRHINVALAGRQAEAIALGRPWRRPREEIVYALAELDFYDFDRESYEQDQGQAGDLDTVILAVIRDPCNGANAGDVGSIIREIRSHEDHAHELLTEHWPRVVFLVKQQGGKTR